MKRAALRLALRLNRRLIVVHRALLPDRFDAREGMYIRHHRLLRKFA